MKKIFLLGFIALFFAGCGSAVKRSEFWEHKTHYQNFDHAKYSWSGYKNPTEKSFKESQGQGWWGIPTPK